MKTEMFAKRSAYNLKINLINSKIFSSILCKKGSENKIVLPFADLILAMYTEATIRDATIIVIISNIIIKAKSY